MLFPVSSFIIKNEDRTFIHLHSLRSDWSESQVTGAVVWDLENQYPILCFGMKQCPICKKEFLSHLCALTPALLVEYCMYLGIHALDSESSSDAESTKSRMSWITSQKCVLFQHCILALLFRNMKNMNKQKTFPLVIMSPNKKQRKNFSPQRRFFRLKIIL